MFSETILLDSADPLAKHLAPAEGTELSELGSTMRRYSEDLPWITESIVENLYYGPSAMVHEITIRNLLYAQGAELAGVGVLREDGKVRALAYTGSFGSLWLVTSQPKTPNGTHWVGTDFARDAYTTKGKKLALQVYRHVVPGPCLEPMSRMLEAGLRPILPMSGARGVGVMNGPLQNACRGSTLDDLRMVTGGDVPRLFVPFLGVATFHLPCQYNGRFKVSVDPEWFNTFSAVCRFAVEKAPQLKALNRDQTIDMLGILARKIPAIAFLSETSIDTYFRIILTETEACFWRTEPGGKPLAKTSLGATIRGRTKCAGCSDTMDGPHLCSCGCGKNYCVACNCVQRCIECGDTGLNRVVTTCCFMPVCADCEGSCCVQCPVCDGHSPRVAMGQCSVCETYLHAYCGTTARDADGQEVLVCGICVVRCPSCTKAFAGQEALDAHQASATECSCCRTRRCSPLLRCLVCNANMCVKCLNPHVRRCLELPPAPPTQDTPRAEPPLAGRVRPPHVQLHATYYPQYPVTIPAWEQLWTTAGPT